MSGPLATVLHIVEAFRAPNYFLPPSRRSHTEEVTHKTCRQQSPQGGKLENSPEASGRHARLILWALESIWTLHLLRAMRNIIVLTR